MTSWSQMSFQDGSSPLMKELIFFHDLAMMVIVAILGLVGTSLILSSKSLWSKRSQSEDQALEFAWTVAPALVLLGLAFPSLLLLYLHDEKTLAAFHVKVMGYQWYWSYESVLNSCEEPVYSYMVGDSELEISESQFRLLDVDNRLVVPYSVSTKCLVSSSDVLHSWTVPALGVKADAVPGRLNQLAIFLEAPGVYFGQCSEICGANHSFMPIVLESVPLDRAISF